MPAASQPRVAELGLAAATTNLAGRVTEDGLRMDEAAFRALYEQTSGPLFGYLLRVTGERELSEDVLQEAYCRFLSHDLPAMDAAQQELPVPNCKQFAARSLAEA